MKQPHCYFDYNASTPVHPRVSEEYTKALSLFANPSSAHAMGVEANNLINCTKESISKAINCNQNEVWFTSGGTESNNWALKGLTDICLQKKKQHIIISAIEHKSILNTAKYLEKSRGIALTILPVNTSGKVETETLIKAIRPDTFLVSVMLANNETGIIQPIREIALICKERGILIHTDAVSALGKIPIDFVSLGVDAISFSAHKLYAPKGTGVLILKESIAIEPLIHGCGQQNSMRSGTENAAGAAAFSASMRLLMNGEFHGDEIGRLTSLLKERLISSFNNNVVFHGKGHKLSNTLSVGFHNVSGTFLQQELSKKGIYVSAGAAASTGSPSHVLTAMGISDEMTQSTLRISLGWGCTSENIAKFLTDLTNILSNKSVNFTKTRVEKNQTEKV